MSRQQPYVLGDYYGSQAAAGTTQATANTTLADHVMVTTVTAGAGVILHAGNADEERSVVNATSTDGLMVYPPVGGAFNGAAANAALELPARSGARFRFYNALTIAAFLGV